MAGKVIQNNFTVDIQAVTNEVMALLSDEQVREVAQLYIAKEAVKKQDEYRKNYSDENRILPGSFVNKLYERIYKQVMFPRRMATVTELPVSEVKPAKAARKTTETESTDS